MYLQPNDGHMASLRKGTASNYDVTVDSRLDRNAEATGRTYCNPGLASHEIKDDVAFWRAAEIEPRRSFHRLWIATGSSSSAGVKPKIRP